MVKKKVSLFIWFMIESKKFTGDGYLKMIFKEDLFRRGFAFVKQSLYDEEMISTYGDIYYAEMDRVIEM